MTVHRLLFPEWLVEPEAELEYWKDRALASEAGREEDRRERPFAAGILGYIAGVVSFSLFHGWFW